MQLAAMVETLQQLLGELILAPDAEDHHSCGGQTHKQSHKHTHADTPAE